MLKVKKSDGISLSGEVYIINGLYHRINYCTVRSNDILKHIEYKWRINLSFLSQCKRI